MYSNINHTERTNTELLVQVDCVLVDFLTGRVRHTANIIYEAIHNRSSQLGSICTTVQSSRHIFLGLPFLRLHSVLRRKVFDDDTMLVSDVGTVALYQCGFTLFELRLHHSIVSAFQLITVVSQYEVFAHRCLAHSYRARLDGPNDRQLRFFGDRSIVQIVCNGHGDCSVAIDLPLGACNTLFR